MGDAFQRRAPPDIGQTLGVHRRLARERPQDGGGEPRLLGKHRKQPGKRNGGDQHLADRRHRIERTFEKAGGKADKIAGHRDIEDLAAAVVQNSIANRGTFDDHQQRIVMPALADDLAAAANAAGGRLQRRQDFLFRRGKRREPGELSVERGHRHRADRRVQAQLHLIASGARR